MRLWKSSDRLRMKLKAFKLSQGMRYDYIGISKYDLPCHVIACRIRGGGIRVLKVETWEYKGEI